MSFHGFIAYFFVVLNNISLSVCASLFIHLLKDILAASKSWQFWIKLLYTFMYRFLCVLSFLLLWNTKEYDHRVIVCLVLLGTAKLSSRFLVPFSIPNSNEREFLLLLHILVSIWYCHSFWQVCSMISFVNSLMIRHVEHPSYAYLPSVYFLWWSIC